MHFKLHAILSSMIKSRAVPLCLTWDLNHPVTSLFTLYTLPAHFINHLTLLVVRSIVMVSQGSCSNNPYFIVIFLYYYIIINPLLYIM